MLFNFKSKLAENVKLIQAVKSDQVCFWVTFAAIGGNSPL